MQMFITIDIILLTQSITINKLFSLTSPMTPVLVLYNISSISLNPPSLLQPTVIYLLSGPHSFYIKFYKIPNLSPCLQIFSLSTHFHASQSPLQKPDWVMLRP